MVKACLRGWGASKQSYSCLGSWVNRLGKFTGPASILMQTQSTRPKAHWVGRYKWLDNHLQPFTDTDLVHSCLLIRVAEWQRRSLLWTSHFTRWERERLHADVSELHIHLLSCLMKLVADTTDVSWSSAMNGMSSISLFVVKAAHEVCSRRCSLKMNAQAFSEYCDLHDSRLNGAHLCHKMFADLINEYTLSAVRENTCRQQPLCLASLTFEQIICHIKWGGMIHWLHWKVVFEFSLKDLMCSDAQMW